MARKTIRLDQRSAALLMDIARRTRMKPTQVLRAALRAVHQRLHVQVDPYAVYAALDVGPGGHARAPARRAKQAVCDLIRAKA
jgi:hypothetical protein